MAIQHNSGMTSSGLVFAFDIFNDRSWNGEPITNQFICPDPYDSNNNVSFNVQGTGTFQRVYNGTFGGYTIKPTDVVYRYNLGGTGCHYHGNSAAIGSGQYVVYSVDYYISPSSTDYPTNSSLITLENYGGSALSGGTGVGGNGVMGKWQTIRGFAGPTGGSGTQAMFLYPGGCGSTYMASRGFILMKNPMFEFRSNVKYNRFVNGTRLGNNNLETSPTQSWNTNGSSYSGGTFTFPGGSYNSRGSWEFYKTYSGLSTGTKYTWSALIKAGTASNLIVTMNNTQSWDTGPSIVASNLSTSEWRRVSITGTTSSGSFNLHLGASYNVEVRDTIQQAGTIFIEDIRFHLTNSVSAISDLTGNNNISANNLTYNSNDTFSFNGSSGYLNRIGFTGHQTNGGTISAWAYPTANSGDLYVIAAGGTGTYGASRAIRIYDGYWCSVNYGSSTEDWNYIAPAELNRWTNIVYVWSGTTINFYINGVLYTNTRSGLITPTGNVLTIGATAWGPSSYWPGQISAAMVYNRALTTAEVQQNYNSSKRKYLGNSSNNAANSALEILAADPNAASGLYWINVPGIGPTELFCDMTTAGGGWIHIGTFSDNNESSNNSSNHPWAYPLNQTNDTGIWEDSNTLGSRSLTSDYKSVAWITYPMTQMLMKDQGSTQRSLFYTNALATPITMSAFWEQRTWGANGSDSSNSAYSGGRVYGLGITNFGVSDPVFDSSNKSIILFKYGEYDGAQDGNKDRTMIAWHRHNAADGVDAPGGIGCFTNRSGTLDYRDIIPTVSGGGDFPPANISNAPYNYTLWVR